MKTISLKLEDRQIKLLNAVSRATRIPKSALIRKGVDLVLSQAKEDIVTADLRREIDDLLQEDRQLLRRLSKA
ncbi:MAG TPA: ribbon-helix-helix domain-containing protein [Acidobacteriota bacterium]|nr:ribbon-helix-helix domain-containing protein [Acidobacteriota bacterium]